MPLELPKRNGTSKDGSVKEKILYKIVKTFECTAYSFISKEGNA
jgi:hypothetical protein